MDILSIIEKKRTKQELSKAEIFFFIDQLVTKKTINDYQASALIMAININGMSENETFYLTDAMLKSGETIDFKGIPGIIIDKHSTGGVGDKISLILSPICVALGIKIAKISGRGLGHTGGTIDKLDSISVNCDLSQNQYMKLLKHDSMFIMSQTDQLTPADKIIYALRNATSTVNSIPLITSSIVCKKMALKTDFVFLDVKVGDGGFCKTLDDALKLSHALLSTFKKYQRPTIIHITNMTQPLGRAIGNAIEVKAAIDFLKGFPESNEVKKLIYDFVADILLTVGKVKKRSDAIHQIDDVVKNGTALQIFKRWVKDQGGNINSLELGKYFNPKHIKTIKAQSSGYINYLSTKTIGLISFKLGAGRLHKEDAIDYHAGIYLNKIKGEFVKKNDTIATLYSTNNINSSIVKEFVNNVLISQKPIQTKPIILKVIK